MLISRQGYVRLPLIGHARLRRNTSVYWAATFHLSPMVSPLPQNYHTASWPGFSLRLMISGEGNRASATAILIYFIYIWCARCINYFIVRSYSYRRRYYRDIVNRRAFSRDEGRGSCSSMPLLFASWPTLNSFGCRRRCASRVPTPLAYFSATPRSL